jgi:hypothetical protein
MNGYLRTGGRRQTTEGRGQMEWEKEFVGK